MPAGRLGLTHRAIGGLPPPLATPVCNCPVATASFPSSANCTSPTSLQWWHKADSIFGTDLGVIVPLFCGPSNQTLVHWRDSSGNGVTLDVSGSNNTPFFSTSGRDKVPAMCINAQPIPQGMQNTSYQITTDSFTLHVALQSRDTQSGTTPVHFNMASAIARMKLEPAFFTGGSFFDRFDFGTNSSPSGVVSAPTIVAAHVISIEVNGPAGTLRLFQNGTQVAIQSGLTIASRAYGAANGFAIGGNLLGNVTAWQGLTFEQQFYGVAQGTSLINQIASCMRTRWAFP